MTPPTAGLPVTWRPRFPPLPAAGAAASGAAAIALARRLLAYGEADLAAIRGVAGSGIVALLGEAAHLPWVDGILYLGQDPAAPNLLLPTTLSPSAAPALLEAALRTRFPDLSPPLAVLPAEGRVLSLAAARPVAWERLRAIVEAQR